MAVKDKTKRLAVSAMLSAVGVVLLYFGAILQVMDISMAVIASVLCVFAVIEYGGYYPWLIYAVTGVIAIIILPQKEAAAVYILFFGFYPIIKEKLEKKKRIVSWVLKEVIFNISLAIMLAMSALLMTADAAEPLFIYIILAVLAEIVFPIYDIALTRVITLYIRKLRPKFKQK